MIEIKCKFCGADIVFVEDVNGKKIPLDIKHSVNGKQIIVFDKTYRVSVGFRDHHPKEPRYQIHVATCKYPEKWVKK